MTERMYSLILWLYNEDHDTFYELPADTKAAFYSMLYSKRE